MGLCTMQRVLNLLRLRHGTTGRDAVTDLFSASDSGISIPTPSTMQRPVASSCWAQVACSWSGFRPSSGAFLLPMYVAGYSGLVRSSYRFHSFMAARILKGLFSIVASAGGLMFIKDMFFFHKYPRKNNIWATAQILPPFLGPLFKRLNYREDFLAMGFLAAYHHRRYDGHSHSGFPRRNVLAS